MRTALCSTFCLLHQLGWSQVMLIGFVIFLHKYFLSLCCYSAVLWQKTWIGFAWTPPVFCALESVLALMSQGNDCLSTDTITAVYFGNKLLRRRLQGKCLLMLHIVPTKPDLSICFIATLWSQLALSGGKFQAQEIIHKRQINLGSCPNFCQDSAQYFPWSGHFIEKWSVCFPPTALPNYHCPWHEDSAGSPWVGTAHPDGETKQTKTLQRERGRVDEATWKFLKQIIEQCRVS